MVATDDDVAEGAPCRVGRYFRSTSSVNNSSSQSPESPDGQSGEIHVEFIPFRTAREVVRGG